MKNTIIGILAILAIAAAPLAARADIFSVSGDLPLTYGFDDGGSADSVSGFKLGLSLPFLVGFGVEQYTITEEVSAGSDFEAEFSIFDVFFNLPIPFVNIALGAGIGQAKSSVAGSTNKYDDATLTQFFFSLGIPIAAVFDVHVGYHVINAEKADVKNSAGATIDTLDLSGTMTSLGIKIGF